ncbi:fumarate reductase subunit FrdD [Ramlibacter sp. AN1133]|uniref:fumarate reductase subunit FrdD n=1 Tax=Ramlibacter sp. AN1133 TaxID=3133429 RepID=UPI0030BD9088
MKQTNLKHSNQAPFWMLFGAGGMVSALIGVALVLITGLAGPLGLFGAANPIAYDNLLAFARNPLGGLFIFVVIALFLWHAAHRIYHTLHDFGIHLNAFWWLCCYGVAALGSIVALVSLLRI